MDVICSRYPRRVLQKDHAVYFKSPAPIRFGDDFSILLVSVVQDLGLQKDTPLECRISAASAVQGESG